LAFFFFFSHFLFFLQKLCTNEKSINESVQSGINVKEQVRLRNEEVKRKEEAQFRLVAKSVQKTDTTSPSLSNLYSTLNSSYSIGGHYSSLKTKKVKFNFTIWIFLLNSILYIYILNYYNGIIIYIFLNIFYNTFIFKIFSLKI